MFSFVTRWDYPRKWCLTLELLCIILVSRLNYLSFPCDFTQSASSSTESSTVEFYCLNVVAYYGVRGVFMPLYLYVGGTHWQSFFVTHPYWRTNAGTIQSIGIHPTVSSFFSTWPSLDSVVIKCLNASISFYKQSSYTPKICRVKGYLRHWTLL